MPATRQVGGVQVEWGSFVCGPLRCCVVSQVHSVVQAGRVPSPTPHLADGHKSAEAAHRIRSYLEAEYSNRVGRVRDACVEIAVGGCPAASPLCMEGRGPATSTCREIHRFTAAGRKGATVPGDLTPRRSPTSVSRCGAGQAVVPSHVVPQMDLRQHRGECPALGKMR